MATGMTRVAHPYSPDLKCAITRTALALRSGTGIHFRLAKPFTQAHEPLRTAYPHPSGFRAREVLPSVSTISTRSQAISSLQFHDYLREQLTRVTSRV